MRTLVCVCVWMCLCPVHITSVRSRCTQRATRRASFRSERQQNSLCSFVVNECCEKKMQKKHTHTSNRTNLKLLDAHTASMDFRARHAVDDFVLFSLLLAFFFTTANYSTIESNFTAVYSELLLLLLCSIFARLFSIFISLGSGYTQSKLHFVK